MKRTRFVGILVALCSTVFAFACEEGASFGSGGDESEEISKAVTCEPGYVSCAGDPCQPIDPNASSECGVCDVQYGWPDGTYSVCDGMCVRTSVNKDHCGYCGHVCAEGQFCDNGECTQKEAQPERSDFSVTYSEGCGDPAGITTTKDLLGITSTFSRVDSGSRSCTATVTVNYDSGWTLKPTGIDAMAFADTLEGGSVDMTFNVSLDGATTSTSQRADATTESGNFVFSPSLSGLGKTACGATSAQFVLAFDGVVTDPAKLWLDTFDLVFKYERCE